MQLFLVRHAESQNNARQPHDRVEDPPITARGRQQAEHLSEWFKTLSVDYLITSPFLRTLQTTRFIADTKDLPVHVWHDVFERGACFRGHGPDATEGGPGLGRSAVIRHLTSDPKRCLIDDSITELGWWHGKRRETDEESVVRAAKVNERLIQTFGATSQTVVLVIHADFKRQLMVNMLHPVQDPMAMGPFRNCGVSKLIYEGERWKLDWFNSVTHMPARLVTGNEH